MFSSVPLISEQVDDAHAIKKIHTTQSASRLRIESVTSVCEHHEVQLVSLGHAVVE